MKKIMILGGSKYIKPVIDTAHKMGIYVITCDYLPNNYAHKYSDEYCNISIIEKDEVLKAAERLKIDGIMSFACDPGVETAAYVAEKMGLPNVGPYKSVAILQNKGKFRKFLENNGFNVPKSKAYDNVKEALEESEYFNWPIIVKPTDSAGSKGVTKVTNLEQLENAIEYAIKYSKSKEFIIEDFLDKQGCSSDCDAFVVNGKVEAIYFSAQRFDKNAPNEYVPAAYTWPETISHQNKKLLNDEIQRLITLLDMKTGVYNIETRECSDGKAYIMECSPRGGGNRLSEMIKYITNVDFIEASINAALGNKIIGIKQVDYSDNWNEVILHSKKSGKFKELCLDKEIERYIIEKDLWVNKDEYINAFVGANDAIGILIFNFKNNVKLAEKFINNIDKYVEIVVD